MRDPIDELENFDPGAPMTPLPPSEVRRLGDRQRRRRTAGVALAAAAAVAAVAGGGALLAGGEPRTAPPTAPSPSVTPTATGPQIPSTIDVTVEMYENDSGEAVVQQHGGLGLTPLDFCGVTPFTDDGRADSVSAATSGPEYSDTREVVLYPDEEAAARALDQVTDAAVGCPRAESGPDTATLTAVTHWRKGKDGIAVVSTYENSLGAEILHFTRIGPALLAASTYGEHDPSNTAPAVADQARRLGPVISQLCALYDRACGTAIDEAPPAADSDDIPADFPLAAGWPTDHEPGADNGLTGPGPDVPALEDVQVCGTDLPVAASLDRLAARWANPEDYRTRLLLTFEDAEGAIQYQGQFLDAYRACPHSEGSDGYTTVIDVRRTQVGGESWAVVRSFELQGAPAIGLEVLHVIRLGRSILVDVTSSEGIASSAPVAITNQTEAAADVVSAMCAFTEAGCVE